MASGKRHRSAGADGKASSPPKGLGNDPFLPKIYDPDSRDGLKLRLSWRIIAVGRMWHRLLDERLRFSNQTQPRWRVLAWARMLPGIKQAELAERMSISGAALVGILDGLARMGLIERRENAEDRRANEIHLTDDAEPVVEAISRQVADVRDYLLQDISMSEMQTLLSLLARIEQRIESASAIRPDQAAIFRETGR